MGVDLNLALGDERDVEDQHVLGWLDRVLAGELEPRSFYWTRGIFELEDGRALWACLAAEESLA